MRPGIIRATPIAASRTDCRFLKAAHLFGVRTGGLFVGSTVGPFGSIVGPALNSSMTEIGPSGPNAAPS